MSDSVFQNPSVLLQKIAEERRLRNSQPAKHPKVNNIFDGIKYDHANPVLGFSIGMTEKETVVLADKFKKAEEAAKASGSPHWPSKMLEILMPTLTPVELVFCTSFIIGQRIRGVI